MKRFILPVLLSATTALASPIVGTWHCIGTDENVQGDTKIEYLPNGSFRGDAILKIDDDGKAKSSTAKFHNNTALQRWHG